MVNAGDAEALVAKGIAAVENDHAHLALVCFERAAVNGLNPTVRSGLGYCLAAVRGEVIKGEQLCREAIDVEPANVFHYRNLGNVLLLAGKKDEAIAVFREGLRVTRDEGIIGRLDTLGTRKAPVIPSLGRDHFLNRWLGVMLNRSGFR